MKFSSYQPVVNPNTINPPAVQAPKNLEGYGTSGKEWTALAGAVGQATKVLAQKQDDEDAADVMDARNRIMTSLTEQLYGEQGLWVRPLDMFCETVIIDGIAQPRFALLEAAC